MKLNDFILAGISGILLFVSFPSFLNLSFSSYTAFPAWIALIPLFFALHKKSAAHSFIIGIFAGFVFFMGVLYWITCIKELGIFSIPLWIILSIYLGFFIGLFSLLQSRIPLFIAPFLWVALEYLRATLFTGFPWALLGYSQYKMTNLIQVSSLGGVYAVSFLIVSFNAGIAYFFLSGRRGEKVQDGLRDFFAFFSPVQGRFNIGKGRKAALILPLLFISAAYFYGAAGRSSQEKKTGSYKATVLQGNIPQDVKWDEKFIDETFRIYSELALAGNERTDLVVWPESASTVYLRYEKKYLSKVEKLSLDLKSEQLIGTPDAEIGADNKVNKTFVSAFHIDGKGRLAGSYDKIHLVPFGEYVPFKEIIKKLERYTSGFSEYTAGKEYTVFRGREPFSVLICYEAVFPGISREFRKRGAAFLVNITNDAWYGRSAMPYQHFSMMVFRAVENRIPVVRSANTGISGFIDARGEITGVTELFEKTKLTQSVIPGEASFTLYTRYGDFFAYVCAGLALLGIIFVRERRLDDSKPS